MNHQPTNQANPTNPNAHPPTSLPITISTIPNLPYLKRQKSHQSIYSPPNQEDEPSKPCAHLQKDTSPKERKKNQEKENFISSTDKTAKRRTIYPATGGGAPTTDLPPTSLKRTNLNKGNPYRHNRERETAV